MQLSRAALAQCIPLAKTQGYKDSRTGSPNQLLIDGPLTVVPKTSNQHNVNRQYWSGVITKKKRVFIIKRLK